MMWLKTHRIVAILGLAGILIGISALLFLVSRPQDTRSRASAASTLYFTPSTTSQAPLQKQIGEIVSFDLMIDPGSNLVMTVRGVLDYDPQLLAIPDDGIYFIPNKAAFPQIVQQPILIGHKIGFTISAGTNDKIIRTPQKVGTVKLKILKATETTPATITLGNDSAIFSVGAEAQYAENVLSSSQPAYIAVTSPTPTPSPTPIPGDPTLVCSPQSVVLSDQYQTVQATLKDHQGVALTNKTVTWSSTGTIQISGPSTTNASGVAEIMAGVSLNDTVARQGTLVATYIVNNVKTISCSIQAESRPITPSPTHMDPTPTPTIAQGNTTLNMEILLHGIGASGDNVLPLPVPCQRTATQPVSETCLSNQNPVHPSRNLKIEIFNADNEIIKTIDTTMTYDQVLGGFKTSVPLGANWTSGTYDIQVYSPKYLSEYLRQNFTIAKDTATTIPVFDLISSDVNFDDAINLLDWNLIADCYTFPGTPSVCDAAQITQVDTDDDNDVDDFDLNLFKRDLSDRSGSRGNPSPTP